MYTVIDNDNAYKLLTGGPVVMISTVSSNGINNIMTCAWNCPFSSNELILVLDMGHTSTHNILQTKKLTIQVPSNKQVETILKAGSVHGHDCGDKFDYFGFSYVQDSNGQKVVEDCLAYIECILKDYDLFKRTGICLVNVQKTTVLDSMWNDVSKDFAVGMQNTVHHVADQTFISGGNIINS